MDNEKYFTINIEDNAAPINLNLAKNNFAHPSTGTSPNWHIPNWQIHQLAHFAIFWVSELPLHGVLTPFKMTVKLSLNLKILKLILTEFRSWPIFSPWNWTSTNINGSWQRPLWTWEPFVHSPVCSIDALWELPKHQSLDVDVKECSNSQ